VVVRINDTGGFHKYGRSIDLSQGAAEKLGIIKQGVAKVYLEVLK
jgi:rare lipoprotein A